MKSREMAARFNWHRWASPKLVESVLFLNQGAASTKLLAAGRTNESPL